MQPGESDHWLGWCLRGREEERQEEWARPFNILESSSERIKWFISPKQKKGTRGHVRINWGPSEKSEALLILCHVFK